MARWCSFARVSWIPDRVRGLGFSFTLYLYDAAVIMFIILLLGLT